VPLRGETTTEPHGDEVVVFNEYFEGGASAELQQVLGEGVGPLRRGSAPDVTERVHPAGDHHLGMPL
jgi:hypothetical protein